jgi:hypothetical protein
MKKYAEYLTEYTYYYNEFINQRLEGGDHTSLGDGIATYKVLFEMYNSKIDKDNSLFQINSQRYCLCFNKKN